MSVVEEWRDEGESGGWEQGAREEGAPLRRPVGQAQDRVS